MNDKLRLSAGTLQRHHGRARNLGGRPRAEVVANEVETEIKACCRTGRREHDAVVNIQDIGVDVDFRVTVRQFRRGTPMGCCTQTVKRTGDC